MKSLGKLHNVSSHLNRTSTETGKIITMPGCRFLLLTRHMIQATDQFDLLISSSRNTWSAAVKSNTKSSSHRFCLVLLNLLRLVNIPTNRLKVQPCMLTINSAIPAQFGGKLGLSEVGNGDVNIHMVLTDGQ